MVRNVYVSDGSNPKAYDLATHRVTLELGSDETNRLTIRDHANVIVYATDDPRSVSFFLGMLAFDINKGK